MYMCVRISNGEGKDLVKKKKGYFYIIIKLFRSNQYQ